MVGLFAFLSHPHTKSEEEYGRTSEGENAFRVLKAGGLLEPRVGHSRGSRVLQSTRGCPHVGAVPTDTGWPGRRHRECLAVRCHLLVPPAAVGMARPAVRNGTPRQSHSVSPRGEKQEKKKMKRSSLETQTPVESLDNTHQLGERTD